jgi:hypothetical protein
MLRPVCSETDLTPESWHEQLKIRGNAAEHGIGHHD